MRCNESFPYVLHIAYIEEVKGERWRGEERSRVLSVLCICLQTRLNTNEINTGFVATGLPENKSISKVYVVKIDHKSKIAWRLDIWIFCSVTETVMCSSVVEIDLIWCTTVFSSFYLKWNLTHSKLEFSGNWPITFKLFWLMILIHKGFLSVSYVWMGTKLRLLLLHATTFL